MTFIWVSARACGARGLFLIQIMLSSVNSPRRRRRVGDPMICGTCRWSCSNAPPQEFESSATEGRKERRLVVSYWVFISFRRSPSEPPSQHVAVSLKILYGPELFSLFVLWLFCRRQPLPHPHHHPHRPPNDLESCLCAPKRGPEEYGNKL